MKVFRETCAASKHDLFDSRYARGHVFLKLLLCHPDYQRRGAGRALALWGIEEACGLGLNTTVFASPMGFGLYQKLGFREIGRFRVQLEGEDSFLEIPALVLPPPKLVAGPPRLIEEAYAPRHRCGQGQEQECESERYIQDSESRISWGWRARLWREFDLRVRLWNSKAGNKGLFAAAEWRLRTPTLTHFLRSVLWDSESQDCF